MKKLFTVTLLLFFVCQLSATTFYQQLCNFNFNWKKYAINPPAGEAQNFASDKELIQAHLGSVLSVLRSNSIAQLNVSQYNSRLHLINVLDEYRTAGKFPINYYYPARIPVFIDDHHTHCAVGYLLQHTGCEEMAVRIAAATNYSWLKDIYDPEFPAWQQASGLSMEELMLIQGAYDFYRNDAFFAIDKYETPQKPGCMLVYFENKTLHRPMDAKPDNIWCKGEGANGALNGKWIQNYAVGMPWIVGYFENGNRSGQWEEYYQGTKQLCRTEHWRNNKLNGIRKRFDRSGNLIEEILFKNGKAIIKTNYSLEDSLTYIRRPIDSSLVNTEIYFEGSLIAAGMESIHNPGNLQWFQNIELTSLNMISVQTRDMSTSSQRYGNQSGQSESRGYHVFSPALVEYKKEGDWVYYREYNYTSYKPGNNLNSLLNYNYRHFGPVLMNSLSMFKDKTTTGYDSLHVQYADNNLLDFYGYGINNHIHLQISYYEAEELPISLWHGYSLAEGASVRECGQVDKDNKKVGEWKSYSKQGQLYKTENYLIAWKEDEE
ncbi:MAG: hypothetical protein ABIQ40_18040 [Bacteroidia bacterium]